MESKVSYVTESRGLDACSPKAYIYSNFTVMPLNIDYHK